MSGGVIPGKISELVFLICLALCGGFMPADSASADLPNILLIFTDDQGYHDVGCYDSEIRTPHIDSLARDGIKFTQWYSASSICTPSRYGLLTGRNPSRSRDALLDALMFLSEEHRSRGIHVGEKTIGAILFEAGYETALVGKWHLGHGAREFLPTRHGFQSFFGHTGGCVDFFTMRYGNTPDWYRNEELVDVTGYATEVITDEVLRFLETARDRPFFLYVSYNAPHFGKGWNDGDNEPVNQLQPPPSDLARVSYIDDITRRKYAAKVVNLDDAVGRVLKSLDDNGLAKDTLVIFLTDHGGDPRYGGANHPYRGQKATLFEGGIRVPCLMRWPGTIRPGIQSDALVGSIDLVPTLCRLSNSTPPKTTDGMDISPLLRGEQFSTADRTMFWELGQHRELKRGTWTAIRAGAWKYIRDSAGSEFLFDVVNDPYEEKDLSQGQTAIRERLAAKAKALAVEYRKAR